MAIMPIQRLAFHRLRIIVDGSSKRMIPAQTIERHQRYCTGVNPRSCSRPPNLALAIFDLVVVVVATTFIRESTSSTVAKKHLLVYTTKQVQKEQDWENMQIKFPIPMLKQVEQLTRHHITSFLPCNAAFLDTDLGRFIIIANIHSLLFLCIVNRHGEN